MIHAGLAGRCRRRSRWTTFADPEARALNLLARNFGPENLTLDTTWAGDITYVRTREGWAYLATVIDLASRRVVGWAMADHMEAPSCVTPWTRPRGTPACTWSVVSFGPAARWAGSTDRRNTSADFRALLAEHHVVQSRSRRAQCWDNAVSESWFGTYKLELIEGRSWPNIATLRSATFAWIEGWSRRAAPPFDPRRDQPRQLREKPSTLRGSSGIINLSAGPGQSQALPIVDGTGPLRLTR
jgi:transposase InsO family protein